MSFQQDTPITVITTHKIKEGISVSQVEDVVKKFCEKVQPNEPECFQYSYSIHNTTSIVGENDAR